MVKKVCCLWACVLTVAMSLSLAPVARGEELGGESVDEVAASALAEGEDASDETDEGSSEEQNDQAAEDDQVAQDGQDGSDAVDPADEPAEGATEDATDEEGVSGDEGKQAEQNEPAVDEATDAAEEVPAETDDQDDAEAASAEEAPAAEETKAATPEPVVTTKKQKSTTEKTSTKKAEPELKAQATSKPQKNGWVKETVGKQKGYVYYVKGKKVTGYRSIDGKGYFFDEKTGLMQTSCAKNVSGKLRLFGEDGVMVTGSGWKQLGGSWYYLKSSVVATGWLASGSWYYLDDTTGIMKCAETFDVSGTTYLADASGACPANAWVKLKGVWYYTNGSCAVRKGWAQYNGDWYYLDPSTGAMKASEVFVAGGKTYVARDSGVCPASDWAKVGSTWYLTNGSCAVRTGWAMDGGTWYYLSPKANKAGIKGAMVTGLQTISGKRYYFFKSGAMAESRFVKLSDGTEAYAASDGSLGAYRKDGIYYNADGSKASGWLRNGNDWYYIDGSTGKPKTGWLDLSGTWYYLDSNGVMVTGERTIGGTRYYFQSDGRWIDISSIGAAVVRAAYSQIGAAYTEANDYYEKDVAFNCSGFSYWCYLDAGYTIPRKQGYYSYYWNENNMEYSQMWWVEKRGNWRTNVSDLRPGDLVFFSPVNDKYRTGHVGVYVGDSMMIDAFPGYGVSKRSVYQSGFVGGGNPLY